MSFKVEQLEEKNMVKLVIEASAEEFEAGLNAAYNKNKNKISVPGFRKGKAPRKMIEQLYGSQIFFEDAANEIIPDAHNCFHFTIISGTKIAAYEHTGTDTGT